VFYNDTEDSGFLLNNTVSTGKLSPVDTVLTSQETSRFDFRGICVSRRMINELDRSCGRKHTLAKSRYHPTFILRKGEERQKSRKKVSLSKN
jgi:hypothetical protein